MVDSMAEPPAGMTWIIVETDLGDEDNVYRAVREQDPRGAEMRVIRVMDGALPESPERKKARLFREAADLIREGTQPSSLIGSRELREGLIRIAEALEVE